MTEGGASPSRPAASPLRLIVALLIVFILPLALGLYLAPRLVPRPKIGVVRLSYDIVDVTAFEIIEQLDYARTHDDVKAVVLIINSPGGSAAYSEELYLDVLNTRQEMPVVATVDLLAASGAYYMAVAADMIYAKPTSSVGSIGVIAFAPEDPFLEEDLITTGPYKAFGGTRDGMIRQIEMAKFSFLEAVSTGRGDRLVVDVAFLSRAEIFTGIQAQEMGLIDGLSSTDGAIQEAARLAGIKDYEVVELYPLAFPEQFPSGATGYRPPVIDPQALWAMPAEQPVGPHFRYVDPSVVR
ncbi:MAG: S49 family peptidase [Chloroflexi bacterium]|nr:S49 family peptidase [Chloroflexota bacterium]MCI0575643.1 S49 family peptidase [Chloroflexota bacterium]MCI0644711.1 S49 family peptidase [Chloroflexota bacterium]MCI0726684.1 S49 family peptidase [Chloroflexota bacterium]